MLQTAFTNSRQACVADTLMPLFRPVLRTPPCLCCRHHSCLCYRHLHTSVADTFHAGVAHLSCRFRRHLSCLCCRHLSCLCCRHLDACVAYLSCLCCRHLDACGRADHAPGRCGCHPAHHCHVHWHTSVTYFYRPVLRASECENRGLIFVLPPPHSFTCLDQGLQPSA